MEQVIHHGLEDGGAIGHAIEYNSEFEDATMGSEGGFPVVLFKDLEVVVTITEVQFGEKLYTLEVIYEVRDKRKEVSIADYPSVDVAVILDHAFRTIFLGNEEDK